jgi:hypothetical protein
MAVLRFCLCGRALREEEVQRAGPMRCAACGRPVGASSSDQTEVIPPAPALELRAVEVAVPRQPPPRPRRPPSRPAEEEDYGLLQVPDNDPPDPDREIQRREARRALARAVKDLKKEERQRPRVWPLEKHWYECLLYAVVSLLLVVPLSMAWATLIVFLCFTLPPRWNTVEMLVHLPVLAPVFLLLGITAAFLQETFAVASAGKTGVLATPGRNPAKTIRRGAQAVWAFLVGPVVPAVVAWFFWLYSGDLEVVDRLILSQLGLVAVAVWVLALLAITESNRFRDANPLAVLALVRRIGYRAPLCAVLIGLAAVGQGVLMFAGLEKLHHGIGGWAILTGCWIGQLFWTVFLLRWLGVSAFRARKTTLPSPDAPGRPARAAFSHAKVGPKFSSHLQERHGSPRE